MDPVRHIVRFNSDTGEVTDEPGGQGYNLVGVVTGQSWAVYGFANGYKHTKKWNIWIKPKRSDYFWWQFKRSRYMICRFCQPREDYYEDNSAACIAANGFLQLSELVDKEKKCTL